MQRAFAIAAALTLSTGLISCSKAKNSQAGAAQSPEWEIALSSTCDNGDCAGKYGFKIIAGGKYEVGPAPNGETKQGTLPTEKLEEFKSALTPVLTSLEHNGRSAAETCSDEISFTTEDRISLKRQGNEQILVHSQFGEQGSTFCFTGITSEQAQALHTAIRKLAEEFYPQPFPSDACTHAIEAVEALYRPLQTCSTDADCVYVATSYEIIPPASTSETVFADDCSLVRPMIAGNSLLVSGATEKLTQARENARQVCSEARGTFFKDNCRQDFFLSSIAPAVCQRNACVRNTATITR